MKYITIILFIFFVCSCRPNYTKNNKYKGDSTIVSYNFNLSQKSKIDISLTIIRDKDSLYVYERIVKTNKKNRYILKSVFMVDSLVLNEYNRYGVKFLLSKYCKKIHYADGIENIVLYNEHNINSKWTIIYLMEKNKYKYVKDDLTGHDIFVPSSINKLDNAPDWELSE
ncbi:hypothetical protein [Hoylesella timonensis]|uniref:hypothetical protein n=1 Tax=Hoylesella timonensis TaxID=386414 RepID=UPI00242ABF7E|nr:hypothetical protein [Hoylesella timonensis]